MDILSLILMFLAIEVFIAFIFYPLRHGENYYHLSSAWGGFIYKFDPDVAYVHKPNLAHKNPTNALVNGPRRIFLVDVRTDKYGFIFTEDLSLLKNRYKLIFCIGGSTTEGTSSPYDKTYPAVLDSLVKEDGYRCVNAGVGGYRSIHELLFFKKNILSWKPWGVIIFSGYNDFEEPAYGIAGPYSPFKHSFSHSLPTNNLERLLNYIAIFHFAKRLGYRLSNNIRTEIISDSRRGKLREALKGGAWINEWKDNVGQIIKLCRENNIKCYLLSHASPVYKDAPREAKDFAENELSMDGRFDIFVDYINIIHANTVELCKEMGAKFIDVSDNFNQYCLDNQDLIQYKKRFSLFVDKLHFSDEGNSMLAKAIYQKIKGEL